MILTTNQEGVPYQSPSPEWLRANWDVLKYEVGAAAADFWVGSVRCVILRGMFGWCAYIGLLDDGLALFNAPESERERFPCHGGVTFYLEKNPEQPHPGLDPDYEWIGWDYSHAFDLSSYTLDKSVFSPGYIPWEFRTDDAGGFPEVPRVAWTVPMVEAELREAAQVALDWPAGRQDWSDEA